MWYMFYSRQRGRLSEKNCQVRVICRFFCRFWRVSATGSSLTEVLSDIWKGCQRRQYLKGEEKSITNHRGIKYKTTKEVFFGSNKAH